MTLPNITKNLIDEALRIEEDVLYSSKSHFNAAALWANCHYWIGIPATLCGVIASVTTKTNTELAIWFSVLTTILTALITFLKPNEKIALHKNFGDQFLALRNDCRIFRTIEIYEGLKDAELTKKLKTLANRRNELNKNSPQIPFRAFSKAKKGIEQGEATHQVDQNS